MIIKNFFYLIIILLIIISDQSFSQTAELNNLNNKIGFSIGYGDQEVKLIGFGIDLNVNYSYEIFFAQLSYISNFSNSNFFDFDLIFQTEYGITYYKPNESYFVNLRSHEIGVSGGVILSLKMIKEILSIYLLLSLGPHYSKKSPERQVSGFMFNSNYNIGVSVFIKNNLFFDIRTGLRHLSNANLKNPNGGINNWIISLGLNYQLEK